MIVCYCKSDADVQSLMHVPCIIGEGRRPWNTYMHVHLFTYMYMYTNNVSNYIDLFVRISHIICNHPLYIYIMQEDVSKSFRTESITKSVTTTRSTRWETIQRFMAAKLTRLTHKIATQLHLVTESCTLCSSRSRRPVRKLLDTPAYSHTHTHTHTRIFIS
jgi:hypothetical protein